MDKWKEDKKTANNEYLLYKIHDLYDEKKRIIAEYN